MAGGPGWSGGTGAPGTTAVPSRQALPAGSPDERARDRLRALAALGAIVLVVLGVPVLLALLLGGPIQRGGSGGAVARAVLTLVLWVAWLHFVACLVTEWRAELRGSGLAPRIPLGGIPQVLARRLVVTALLLSGTAALVVPVTYSQATTLRERSRSAGVPRAIPPTPPRPQLAPPSAADQAPAPVPPTRTARNTSVSAPRAWTTAAGPGVLRDPVGPFESSPDAFPFHPDIPAPPGAGPLPDHEIPADDDPFGDAFDANPRDAQASDDLYGDPGDDLADAVLVEATLRDEEIEAHPAWQVDPPELVSPTVDRHGQLVPGERVVKLYEVQPAEGRHHDTLWGIAERFLGDGLRYREIFDLNEGRTQPDGRTLSKPSLIHAGWVLLLPADAQGDGLRVMRMPEPTSGRSATDEDDHVAPRSDLVTIERAQAGPIDHDFPAELVGEPPLSPHLAQASLIPALDPVEFTSAGLLAAGVLVALARRRRPAAGRPADAAEEALLLAADTEAARFVDRALRVLAVGLTTQGRLLPPVYAAILTEQTLILHMAPAETEPPPSPWAAGEIDGSWRMDRIPELLEDHGPAAAQEIPAPFPALVSFGHDDAGSRILVDLEGAPGVISILGDRTVALQVAIAVALELATNLWSDDLRVCLVGFPPDEALDELLSIVPERLWTAPSAAAALDELSEPEDDAAGHLGGDDFPLEAGQRIAGNPGALAPDLLILAEPAGEEETDRLVRMARGRRHAIGVLTIGDSRAAQWRFTVESDHRMSLGVLGVDVWAQSLTPGQYAAIAALFRDAPPSPPPTAPMDEFASPAAPAALPPAPGDAGERPLPEGTPGGGHLNPLPVDDVTRPPAIRGSVPGVVPWTPPPSPPPAAAPVPSAAVTSSGARPDPADPAEVDQDSTRPPANGRRQPVGPPPAAPPPGGTLSPTALKPAAVEPPSVRPAAIARGSVVSSAGSDDDPANIGPGLLSHPGRPLIRPTDIPLVPPVLYFETPRMRANREAGVTPASGPEPSVEAGQSLVPWDARTDGSGQPALAAFPDPGAAAQPAGPGRYGRPVERVPTPPRPIPPRPPVPPPNEAKPATTPPFSPQAVPAADPPAATHYSDGDPTIPGRIPRAADPYPPAEPSPPRAPEEPPATGEAQVRLLGVPTVEAPGPLPAADAELLTEIVVYLALHREGADRHQLAEEISFAGAEPAGSDAVAAAMEKARRWLGVDAEGQPRLAIDPQGRWRLAPEVRCDWELFVAYNHRAEMPGSDSEADLTTALRMVSGALWTNLPADRYRWATAGPIARGTRAGIVDVAHRLAGLTLDFGDTMTAMAACRTGLRAVPTSQVLWRDLLRTVAARGDRRTLEAVATEMYRTISTSGTRRGGRAEAETDALVQTLLPGFRRARR
ncbi:LysM peptidoglycan-binding domain-containing protein [Frankia sp. AgKG'84/4]|uniref:LysM peptidoglycan-binding domain-containing protein n=1 Tax=Frankia sp. AgKG'84/4 TaxID=573490 RepID=UPI002029B796|nr:LysM peptidoglycan-binding domain-containing protein [Frankia sp. AgKG'84/4]MCL9796427.1 LysM peptidoglycan-binding domain-containing protein [Frankia sp. AgKG'84/4]